MTVLEPGPAMGFFTLPLARLVGPEGRVVAVEVQQKMLDRLMKRARRARLAERIEPRLVAGAGLGVAELAGRVDFVAAIHVVHEVSDQDAFFRDALAALKPEAKLLLVEPPGHVKAPAFAASLARAQRAGFAELDTPAGLGERSALLARPAGVGSSS
jgi:cyclopropane fatty-acyl-phospholipid synthase-like methyltransferase